MSFRNTVVNPSAVCLALLTCLGCSTQHQVKASVPSSQSVVIWISIDGDRADYVDRAKPPTLMRLMHEGAYTQHLTPGFPSLTFASHTTEVTGVLVDQHGIPGNSFYDTSLKTLITYPDQSLYIRAEPIWVTAERQGVRTAVVDWPLSGFQTGPVKAAYFGTKFDNSISDADRVQKLIDLWSADKNATPLRLLIGYVHQVDVVGHAKGPLSDSVLDALRQDDAVIAHLIEQATVLFDARMKPEDELYVVISTDHGMSPLKTLVNCERLLGADLMSGVHIATSGPVANLFLDDVPVDQRSARQDAILQKLKATPDLEVFSKSEIPARWHYNDPTRVGDIVAVWKTGTAWQSMRAIARGAAGGHEVGMHGYPPEENPEMQGLAIIWRYRHKLGGIDLGKVDTVQLEPTVAKLLGIQPAAAAVAKPLDLPNPDPNP